MEKDHLEIILDEMNWKLDMLIESQKTFFIESKKYHKELKEKFQKSALVIRC